MPYVSVDEELPFLVSNQGSLSFDSIRIFNVNSLCHSILKLCYFPFMLLSVTQQNTYMPEMDETSNFVIQT